MTSADLTELLRASRPVAPDTLRERVRAIAAAGPAPAPYARAPTPTPTDCRAGWPPRPRSPPPR